MIEVNQTAIYQLPTAKPKPTKSATSEELLDITSSVNTQDKYLGREVFNSTIGFFVKAKGPLPEDKWIIINSTELGE